MPKGTAYITRNGDKRTYSGVPSVNVTNGVWYLVWCSYPSQLGGCIVIEDIHEVAIVQATSNTITGTIWGVAGLNVGVN